MTRLLIFISLFTAVISSSFSSGLTQSDWHEDLIEVSSSPSVVINIDNRMLRKLPDDFFGYNLEVAIFESDSVYKGTGIVKQELLNYYKQTPNFIYRYPGGLMANHFNWEWSEGSPSKRPVQKLADWEKPSTVLFGLNEYLAFLNNARGKFWYTLNLNGWSETTLNGEHPSKDMAESNKRLAAYILSNTPNGSPHYYQLGNELDRSIYEWSTDKYIQRSLDTIHAINTVDPNARYVAFLRDFDYRYRYSLSKSSYKDFMRDVFSAMPMIDDISFNYYYNTPKQDKPRTDIPTRLRMFKEAINIATRLRNGKAPRVWVTEHGQASSPDIKGNLANTFTAGLSGAISAADFWIAIAQIPEIQGAFLYSNGHWNIFQNIGSNSYPLPMYWTVRLLRTMDLPIVLATKTSSQNYSAYQGGYDVRAVAFSDESRRNYGLWAMNRAARTQPANIMIPALSGRTLKITHDYISGRESVAADTDRNPPKVVMGLPTHNALVGKDGSLIVTLPANSVSSFKFEIVQ